MQNFGSGIAGAMSVGADFWRRLCGIVNGIERWRVSV